MRWTVQVATPRGRTALWAALDALIFSKLDRPTGLLIHGLGPIAAEVLDRRGLAVPAAFRRQQREARVAALTAPAVLERVRAACDGPVLLMKGPEAAERYPGRARAYGDIDLLVPDAGRAQRQLRANGFVEQEDPEGIWVGIHHLGQLHWPGTRLAIEIHSEPKWLDGVPSPRTEELLEAAVPSRLGVADILAPHPGHHALLLAAHGWAHQPLGRVRDLIDVGAFRVEADPLELDLTARAWGVRRMWRTTNAALDAILDRQATWPLRLWAGHLREVRDETVLEAHLERLLAPLWGYPSREAARRVGRALVSEVRPAHDETWVQKVTRVATALRRPLAPLEAHRRKLGASATRGRRLPPEPEHDPDAGQDAAPVRNYPKG
jgi:hypothetical protein